MKIKKLKAKGYYIPFLESLAQFLSMWGIFEYLNYSKCSDLIEDVKDAAYYKNHEFFIRHPDVLCFTLCVDDFEVANPFGTHRNVHKVTVFYYLNI